MKRQARTAKNVDENYTGIPMKSPYVFSREAGLGMLRGGGGGRHGGVGRKCISKVGRSTVGWATTHGGVGAHRVLVPYSQCDTIPYLTPCLRVPRIAASVQQRRTWPISPS